MKILLDKQTVTITDKDSGISIRLVESRPEREKIFEAVVGDERLILRTTHGFGEGKIKQTPEMTTQEYMKLINNLDEINVYADLCNVDAEKYNIRDMKRILNVVAHLLFFYFGRIRSNVSVYVSSMNLDRSLSVRLP